MTWQWCWLPVLFGVLSACVVRTPDPRSGTTLCAPKRRRRRRRPRVRLAQYVHDRSTAVH